MNPLLQPALMQGHGPGKLENRTHRTLLILLGAAWCGAVLRQFPATAFLPGADWPEALLLVAALVVTVSTYARRVSLQSAAMAAFVIALIGGTAHWLSALTGIPFGPVRFANAVGFSPFQGCFAGAAALWVILLLNARGVARLILRPLAKHRNYGLVLLGGSLWLLLLMAMAMEPFSSTVHHYWLWSETRLPVSWEGVPLSCLFAWCVVGLVASLAATPFLINKRPRPLPPPVEPAWLWTLMSGLFAAGNASAGLWPAMAVAVANGLIGAALAFSAARQSRASAPAR